MEFQKSGHGTECMCLQSLAFSKSVGHTVMPDTWDVVEASSTTKATRVIDFKDDRTLTRTALSAVRVCLLYKEG